MIGKKEICTITQLVEVTVTVLYPNHTNTMRDLIVEKESS